MPGRVVVHSAAVRAVRPGRCDNLLQAARHGPPPLRRYRPPGGSRLLSRAREDWVWDYTEEAGFRGPRLRLTFRVRPEQPVPGWSRRPAHRHAGTSTSRVGRPNSRPTDETLDADRQGRPPAGSSRPGPRSLRPAPNAMSRAVSPARASPPRTIARSRGAPRPPRCCRSPDVARDRHSLGQFELTGQELGDAQVALVLVRHERVEVGEPRLAPATASRATSVIANGAQRKTRVPPSAPPGVVGVELVAPHRLR